MQRFFASRAPHEQQEVFVRAFSERGRLAHDGLSPFGACLRGILKNLVVDDFRKRKAALAVFGAAVTVGDGEEDAVDNVTLHTAGDGFARGPCP